MSCSVLDCPVLCINVLYYYVFRFPHLPSKAGICHSFCNVLFSHIALCIVMECEFGAFLTSSVGRGRVVLFSVLFRNVQTRSEVHCSAV